MLWFKQPGIVAHANMPTRMLLHARPWRMPDHSPILHHINAGTNNGQGFQPMSGTLSMSVYPISLCGVTLLGISSRDILLGVESETPL